MGSEGEKALFIPLKRQHFENFKSGTKDTEYRRYGKRWHEGTCRVGRKTVLSLGYGKKNRMTRTVRGFERKWKSTPEWIDCYGEPGWAACIYLPPPRPTGEDGHGE